MIWPHDFLAETLAEPKTWGQAGLVMFFNLECPGCVSRGIPVLKRLDKDYPELKIMLIHTAFGHKHYSRDEVVPTLKQFAENFAKLSFPIALDLDGSIAKHYEAAGTPHWLLFSKEGKLIKSLFGSQDNTQNRLEYALESLFADA